MQIFQANSFKKVIKKLHLNQKLELDLAVKTIIQNPLIGEKKADELSSVRVYKFQMITQLMLLAYLYNANVPSIVLLALGSHENFYRGLKEQL